MYLAVRTVDIEEAYQIFLEIDLRFLAPMIVVWVAALLVRVYRWYFMFSDQERPAFPRVYDAFVIGNMLNNLLPGRLGDIARAGIIGRKMNVSGTSGALATIVLEKVIDGLIVLFLIGGVFLLAPFPAWLYSAVIVGGMAFLAVLLALFITLKLFYEIDLQNASNQAQNGLLYKAGMHIKRIVQKFSFGLHVLRTRRDFVRLIVLTFPIWFLETASVYLAFSAYRLELSILAAAVVISFLCVATMLPAAPGFIGTYQFVIVTALALYGVSENQSLALGVFLNLFVIVCTTFVGVMVMIRKSWKAIGITKQIFNGK